MPSTDKVTGTEIDVVPSVKTALTLNVPRAAELELPLQPRLIPAAMTSNIPSIAAPRLRRRGTNSSSAPPKSAATVMPVFEIMAVVAAVLMVIVTIVVLSPVTVMLAGENVQLTPAGKGVAHDALIVPV